MSARRRLYFFSDGRRKDNHGECYDLDVVGGRGGLRDRRSPQTGAPHHRYRPSRILGAARKSGQGARAVHRDVLVGLKLAHETTDILTLRGRRRFVRHLRDHPEAESVRERHVAVDLQSMKDEVRKGLSMLARAREAIAVDETVLAGAACIRGPHAPSWYEIRAQAASGTADEYPKGNVGSYSDLPQWNKFRKGGDAFVSFAYGAGRKPNSLPRGQHVSNQHAHGLRRWRTWRSSLRTRSLVEPKTPQR